MKGNLLLWCLCVMSGQLLLLYLCNTCDLPKSICILEKCDRTADIVQEFTPIPVARSLTYTCKVTFAI